MSANWFGVRDVLTSEVKFFLANAPKKTSVEILLKVAFSRWRVERCFEDDKKYVGLDHFEGRGYPGLMRHLVLSAVSLLFLARERERLLEEYPELTDCRSTIGSRSYQSCSYNSNDNYKKN